MTRPDIRQAILALLTEFYADGPDGTRRPSWPSGPQGGWTEPEVTAAFGFATSLFLMLAWEVDAAQIDGRDVSVAGFLQQHALTLAVDAPGERR